MTSEMDSSGNKFWTLGDDPTLEEDILDIITKKKLPKQDDKTNYLGVPTSTNRYMGSGATDYIRESPNELMYPGKKTKKNVNFQDGSRDESASYKIDETKREGLIDHLRGNKSSLKKYTNYMNQENIFNDESVYAKQNKTDFGAERGRPHVIVERDHTGKYRLTVKGNYEPSPEKINKTYEEKNKAGLARQSWDVMVRDLEYNVRDTFERNENMLRNKFGILPERKSEGAGYNSKSTPQLMNKPPPDLFKYSYVNKYAKKDNDFNINQYLNEHYISNPVFKSAAFSQLGRSKFP